MGDASMSNRSSSNTEANLSMTNAHDEWGSEGISFNEFCSIGFKTSFPCLFYDLIFYLTKKAIQGHNEIWEEDEE